MTRSREEWAASVWAHVVFLVRKIGPRGSATYNERRAAHYAEAELVKLGLSPDMQRFRSPTSAWRPFTYLFGVALLMALVAPLANAFSGVMAALVTLMVLGLLVQELRLQETPLRLFLPHGQSQNVIGRLPPTGETRQRVVVVAHLDTHRTPFFHQNRQRQKVLDFLFLLAAVGLLVNTGVYLLAAFTGWSWPYWIVVPFAALHLMGIAVTLQADFTPYSPGANDNAGSVGVALTLAEALTDRPLRHTELWFLFSGCEEVGCYGMRAFLRKYGSELTNTRFIDFEMVVNGEPGIVGKEGILIRHEYDRDLVALAGAAAAAVWQPAHVKVGGAYGESVVTHQQGYSSVTLNTVLPETGEPAAWHRPDDDLRVVNRETLGHVVAWGLELLRRIDKDSRS